nr:hypothetical protein [uncultured Alloprevotella sp.]
MKKSFLFLSFVCMGVMGGYAQDDVYFVPNGQETKENVSNSSYQRIENDNNSTWYEGRSSKRSVDEYNRRDSKTKSSSSAYYDNEDYSPDGECTARIVRFHSPRMVVVASPYYWDFYDTYLYDPWLSSSWYWNSRWGWSNRYGWYDPWYSWTWGGYYNPYNPYWSWSNSYWGWGNPYWNYYTWNYGPRGWRDTNRGGWGGRRDFDARNTSASVSGSRGGFAGRRTGFEGTTMSNNRSFGNRSNASSNNRSFGNRSFESQQQPQRQSVPRMETFPNRSFGQPAGGSFGGGRSFGNSTGGFSTGGRGSVGGSGGGRTFGR